MNVLRKLGCTLRIQVWYLGEEEMADSIAEFYIQHKVEAINIMDYTDEVVLIESNVGLRPFQLKPMALLYVVSSYFFSFFAFFFLCEIYTVHVIHFSIYIIEKLPGGYC